MIGQENADSGSCMIGAMRRHVAARASDIFCRFLFEDQVDDILAAGDLTLDADVMKKIDAVTKEILYPMG